MTERIEKKMAQIEKITKKVAKYEAKLNDEQRMNALLLNWKQLSEYCGRDHELEHNMEDFRRATKELKTAREQLENIKKMEDAKAAKERTLNDMPEALKQFMDHIIDRWTAHDLAIQKFYESELERMESQYPANSIQGYKDFVKEYKYSAYEMIHTSEEDFRKANIKNAKAIVVNLINRVIEKTGKITDASGLHLEIGNAGWPVINGVIIGECGNATVESIGAGGYNIQRYHIRTLVK